MRLLTVLGCALLAAIVVASAAASPSQRTGGVLSVTANLVLVADD